MLPNTVLETSHDARISVDGLQKLAIAVLASSLLEPGTSVVLDVGTTTETFAKYIAGNSEISGLTIVTNGLQIASSLEGAMPRNEVFVTGGMLRPMQHSLVQTGVVEGIKRFRTSAAFIGVDGIHPDHGVTTTNLPEADIKEAMRSNTERAVLMAAASKLGEVASVKINSLGAFDTLITSEDADPALVSAFEDQGLEVLIAPNQLALDSQASDKALLGDLDLLNDRYSA
jgi:DeoR family transcriptional regulator of aga operon